jgi:NADH-quinone oxidoreductase subunit L
MGGLRRAMPLAFLSFLIGSAALSALPFTSGYYSKDEILSAVYSVSPGLWAAGCLGAMLTGLYSFRPVLVIFFGVQARDVGNKLGWRMRIPLMLLSVLALLGGMLKIPLDSVFPVLLTDEGNFSLVAVIAIAAPFIGVLIAMLFYLDGGFSVQGLAGSGWINRMRIFCFNGWGIDTLYNTLAVRPFKTIAKLNKNDALDGVCTMPALFSRELHLALSALQTGGIRWYVSSMALGTVIIIAIGCLS